MELLKNFFLYSILMFIAAFILSFLIGGLVNLCYPHYTMQDVLYGALGCGIGTGLGHGLYSFLN